VSCDKCAKQAAKTSVLGSLAAKILFVLSPHRWFAKKSSGEKTTQATIPHFSSRSEGAGGGHRCDSCGKYTTQRSGVHICSGKIKDGEDLALRLSAQTDLPPQAFDAKATDWAVTRAKSVGYFVMTHAVSGEQVKCDGDDIAKAMREGYVLKGTKVNPSWRVEVIKNGVKGSYFSAVDPGRFNVRPPDNLLGWFASVYGANPEHGQFRFGMSSLSLPNTLPTNTAYASISEIEAWEQSNVGQTAGMQGSEYVVGDTIPSLRAYSSLRNRGTTIKLGRSVMNAAQRLQAGAWQIIPTADGGAELYETIAPDNLRGDMIAKVLVDKAGRICLQEPPPASGTLSEATMGALCGWLALPGNQAANRATGGDKNPIHADWHKADYVLADTMQQVMTAYIKQEAGNGVFMDKSPEWDECSLCHGHVGHGHQCPVLYKRADVPPEKIEGYKANPNGPTTFSVGHGNPDWWTPDLADELFGQFGARVEGTQVVCPSGIPQDLLVSVIHQAKGK
jgi:hypothetical protein